MDSKEKIENKVEEEAGKTVENIPEGHDLMEIPGHKACTDLGNAERIHERFGHEFCYCQENKRFYVFRNGHWIRDSGVIMNRMAQKVVKSIPDEADDERLSPEQKSELKAWAKKSGSKGRLRAMIDLARWLPGVAVSIEQLDQNPMQLNCANGTIDLKTGELKEHNPRDLITKMVPASYDKNATCPIWEATIKKIMEDNAEIIAFLKRMLGYFLTGLISEQCLFVFYGTGANGKSTILEIFRELLSGYALHTTTASLLGTRNSPIGNDLARLKGARFVSAVEVGMGKKLDESLIKQLTGGDPVTSRFLYREFFEYHPEFKLIIAANHKPEIQGVDHGIWRRIHLIPFDVTIPAEEIDRDLPNKLRAELSGILTWAVQGCLEWQAQGLNVPDSIANATAAYRAEMDIIAEFLADRCELNATEKTTLGDLYDAYTEWANKACQDAVGKKIFGNLMRQKDFKQSKSNGARYWQGIKLVVK